MKEYIYFYGHVAQLVEQRPEEPRVTGSSPVVTTNPMKPKASFFVAKQKTGVSPLDW